MIQDYRLAYQSAKHRKLRLVDHDWYLLVLSWCGFDFFESGIKDYHFHSILKIGFDKLIVQATGSGLALRHGCFCSFNQSGS